MRPKTILDWFRRLYSEKYDSSKSPRRKGRPAKPKEVRELVIRLAQENLDSPRAEGAACVQIPPRSPNCNPFAERFVRSIKDECLQHFVFFGERHLRYVIDEYMAHITRSASTRASAAS